MAHGGKRDGSGRKAGVPNKATADGKAAAQGYGAAAIVRLAELAGLVEGKPAAASEQAQVVACKEILDRGYGKLPQAVTVDPTDEAVDLMKDLLTLIDGQSRGLSSGRADLVAVN